MVAKLNIKYFRSTNQGCYQKRVPKCDQMEVLKSIRLKPDVKNTAGENRVKVFMSTTPSKKK